MLRPHSVFLLALTAFAAEPPDTPIAVRAVAIAEPDGGVWRVNVSIGNRSKSALGPVTVSLVPGGAESWKTDALAPGEWKNDTIALRAGNPRYLTALVEYSVDQRPDSFAEQVAMPLPDKPWWNAIASAATPVALGAIIGFVGVIITSLVSLKKERVTAALQFKRSQVERYEAPYRDFLSQCGNFWDAPALKKIFETLDKSALVPDRLHKSIETGIQAVEAASDDAAKRAARDKFLGQVRSELQDPFQDK